MGLVPLSRETRAALLLLSLLFASFSLASLDIQMSAKTHDESPETMQPMIRYKQLFASFTFKFINIVSVTLFNMLNKSLA